MGVRFISIILSLALSYIALAADELHNVIGCRIFSADMNLIRSYAGQTCLFFADGRFLSSNKRELKFFDANMNLLWSKTLHVHHQLNPSNDGKAVLVMSSEVKSLPIKGVPADVRMDRLVVFDRNGKEVKNFSFFNHRAAFERLLEDRGGIETFGFDWDKDIYPDLKWEQSHANSFYEIPIGTKSSISAFRAGNYIVNANDLGLVFILDRQLKNILWHDFLGPKARLVHDAQVLKNGNILLYRNSEPKRWKSTLEEYDPVLRKIVWQYPQSAKPSFYSQYGGGVQLLENGNILFNILGKDNWVVEVDRSGTTVSRFPVPDFFLQVKRLHLGKFLALNPGI